MPTCPFCPTLGQNHLRKYLVPTFTPWGIHCPPRDDIRLVHPYLNGPRKMIFACTCQFVPKIKLRPHPAMSHCKMLIPLFMIPKPHSSMSHSKPLISSLAIPSGSGWSLHPLISSNPCLCNSEWFGMDPTSTHPFPHSITECPQWSPSCLST